MPTDVTVRTITYKTVIETFSGTSKKAISRIADNNLWSGKYPQVGYLGFGEGEVTLIFK